MNSSTCYLEHANLTVRNLDEAIRFVTTAFPQFAIRGRGVSDGTPWVHVGTDTTYLAFSEDANLHSERVPYDDSGFNHLGFVVEDVNAVASALRAAGYEEGFRVDPNESRQRMYFLDADGIEWEFVQYFSDDPKIRNDYST
jgi:catechol 2,3-dioxygenase-like lactoylglutathione lyase family enzyme